LFVVAPVTYSSKVVIRFVTPFELIMKQAAPEDCSHCFWHFSSSAEELVFGFGRLTQGFRTWSRSHFNPVKLTVDPGEMWRKSALVIPTYQASQCFEGVRVKGKCVHHDYARIIEILRALQELRRLSNRSIYAL
jgi:hypothetical protein